MKNICIEGIVGAGKTTQINLLHNFLSPDSYLIPELNGLSPLKQAIIQLKERVGSGELSFDKKDVEYLAKARVKTTQRLIETQDGKRKYNLMDRGIYTAAVFESGTLSPEEIIQINLSAGVILPEKCIVLECSPEEALRRIDERRMREGIYSHRAKHESEEFILKIRELYRKLVENNYAISILDSSRSAQEVFSEIREALGV